MSAEPEMDDAPAPSSPPADDVVEALVRLAGHGPDISDVDVASSICDAALGVSGADECLLSAWSAGRSPLLLARTGPRMISEPAEVLDRLAGQDSATCRVVDGPLSHMAIAHVAGVSGAGSEPVSECAVCLGGGRNVTTVATLLSQNSFDAATLARVEALAHVAGALLAHRARLAAACELAAQLQDALDGRVIIEQAKGILAERGRTTMPEAFSALRTLARRERIALRAAADAVVNRRPLD